jgi:predicted DNA-binding protein (MmcQ/YjbR family)
VRPAAFNAACLALPGTHLVVQWGGSSVYKVGPKVFAIAGLARGDNPQTYVFKVSDMAYELLIEHGAARSAPYLGRAKWVQLVDQDALEDDDLRAYLRQAHALIAARLTRAQRRALGLAEPAPRATQG